MMECWTGDSKSFKTPTNLKARPVRGTDQFEAILRILPLCQDIFRFCGFRLRRCTQRLRTLGKLLYESRAALDNFRLIGIHASLFGHGR